MATSIIPDPRPLFIERTYTCGTGTIYPVTHPTESSRKIITKAGLGITNIQGYVMAGIKSYMPYNGWLTVTMADPKNDENVLYLQNFTSWDISTTVQITIVWVRADKAIAG